MFFSLESENNRILTPISKKNTISIEPTKSTHVANANYVRLPTVISLHYQKIHILNVCLQGL